jgi:hypothetical protein
MTKDIKEIADRYWSKVNIGEPDECWEWTASKLLNGYGQFMLNGRPRTAHRIAWMLTHGPIPDGMLVMHLYDNKACCNPAHLSLGTYADNTQDMVLKGRARGGAPYYGEDNGNAKVTTQKVKLMRILYGTSNYTYKSLATKFGISVVQVGRIIRCESWRT